MREVTVSRVPSQKHLCACSAGFMGCPGRCEGTAAHSEFPPQSVPCSLQAGEGPARPAWAARSHRLSLEKPPWKKKKPPWKNHPGKTTTGTGLGMSTHSDTRGWQQPRQGQRGTARARNGNHPEPSLGMGTGGAGRSVSCCQEWENDGFGSSGGMQGESCCSGCEIPLGSAHTQPGGASRPPRCHPSPGLWESQEFSPGIGQASDPGARQESLRASVCPTGAVGSRAAWQGLEEQPCRGRSRVQAGRSREWGEGGRDGCQELRAPGTGAGELLEPSRLPSLDLPHGGGQGAGPPQPSGIPGFSKHIPVQRIPWAWRVGGSEEPPWHLPVPAVPRAESRLIFGNCSERGSRIQEQARSCLECSGSSAMGTFFHGVVRVAELALLGTGSEGSWVFSFSPQGIHLECGLLDTKCSRGKLG